MSSEECFQPDGLVYQEDTAVIVDSDEAAARIAERWRQEFDTEVEIHPQELTIDKLRLGWTTVVRKNAKPQEGDPSDVIPWMRPRFEPAEPAEALPHLGDLVDFALVREQDTNGLTSLWRARSPGSEVRSSKQRIFTDKGILWCAIVVHRTDKRVNRNHWIRVPDTHAETLVWDLYELLKAEHVSLEEDAPNYSPAMAVLLRNLAKVTKWELDELDELDEDFFEHAAEYTVDEHFKVPVPDAENGIAASLLDLIQHLRLEGAVGDFFADQEIAALAVRIHEAPPRLREIWQRQCPDFVRDALARPVTEWRQEMRPKLLKKPTAWERKWRAEREAEKARRAPDPFALDEILSDVDSVLRGYGRSEAPASSEPPLPARSSVQGRRCHWIRGVPAEVYGRHVLLVVGGDAENRWQAVVGGQTRDMIAWLKDGGAKELVPGLRPAHRYKDEMLSTLNAKCGGCGQPAAFEQLPGPSFCMACLLRLIANEQEALVRQTDLDTGDLAELLRESGYTELADDPDVLDKLRATPAYLRELAGSPADLRS